jgi:hypothetical protein
VNESSMHSLATLATLATAFNAVDAHYLHSALVFTRHGDRTAKFYPGYEMTNLGAQQMYQSGQYYRERYLTGDHPISGISRDQVVSSQIWASAPDQHVLYQTATNFLQGLYPPLDGDSSSTEELNNGSTISDPLNGYQFILVHGEDTDAPSTIWLKGDDSCPAYTAASDSYTSSADYESTLASSADFYSQFIPQLGPILGDEDVSYANAYNVFDLLNVASIHNRTIDTAPFDYTPFTVPASALAQARYYADQYSWHANFNASQPVRSVSGMTLAGGILAQLDTVVQNNATTKFSLMAGSYDTFLSFFGLVDLQDTNGNFTGLPNYAASMAIELFSEDELFREEDLMVRWHFRNGTDENEQLDAWPLFGGRQIDVPYNEFVERLSARAIRDVGEWCGVCGSTEAFCVAANQTAGVGAEAKAANGSGSGSGLSNAAAGGIGAVVALAVVALLGAAFWLVRSRRRRSARVVEVSHTTQREKSLSDDSTSDRV